MKYSLDKSLESTDPNAINNIASEHKFVLQGAERQSLAIFSTANTKGLFNILILAVLQGLLYYKFGYKM